MKIILAAIQVAMLYLPGRKAFIAGPRAAVSFGHDLSRCNQLHRSLPIIRNQKYSTTACYGALAASVGDITSTGNQSPMKSLTSFLGTLWDFTRPHTIVGSALSVIALYAFATPSQMWLTKSFAVSLLSSLLPALFMNLYITGLNQVTDIEIDKVNKPYLPLAAGTLTRNNGIAVVVLSLIASLLLVRTAAWPLQATVIGSGILGTLYSLPPFRLKRFPMLAAFCILVVRGSLVNMGFFFQAKADVVKTALPSLLSACRQFPESVVLTAFFAIFGVVIALMKDVPDIDGDKKFNIPSFSVKRGAAAMFRSAWSLLVLLLSGSSLAAFASTFPVVSGAAALPAAVTVSRATLGAALGVLAWDVRTRAVKVNTSAPSDVFDYYMYIWKVFYGCYFLLPLVR